MPLRLLRDRIQVLPDRVRDDVSSAGIVIAASKGIVDSQKQFGREGVIVAMGPDVDAAQQLHVGDRILWGEFVFPEYDEAGERFLVLQDKDVTAVFEAGGLRPLYDRVLVERDGTPEKTTAGGIVLPGFSSELPTFGTVVAAGPGDKDSDGVFHAAQALPGARVLFGRNAGQTAMVNGEQVLVMRQDDLVAVIEAEAA